MQSYIITSTQDFQYSEFRALYEKSFPDFEQRTEAQQVAAFEHPHYRLLTFANDEMLIGFIGCWQFEDYIYIEHFAIHEDLRGMGYGTELLKIFIEAMEKRVVLEIDPVVDDTTAARLRFYQNCGFKVNTFVHLHPPYLAEKEAHPLVVLSTEREMSEDEREQFTRDLSEVVMNF